MIKMGQILLNTQIQNFTSKVIVHNRKIYHKLTLAFKYILKYHFNLIPQKWQCGRTMYFLKGYRLIIQSQSIILRLMMDLNKMLDKMMSWCTVYMKFHCYYNKKKRTIFHQPFSKHFIWINLCNLLVGRIIAPQRYPHSNSQNV